MAHACLAFLALAALAPEPSPPPPPLPFSPEPSPPPPPLPSSPEPSPPPPPVPLPPEPSPPSVQSPPPSDPALLARLTSLEALLASEAEAADGRSAALSSSWKISSAILVVFMQFGFAMVEAGTVREHNAIATYAKNMLDYVLGVLVAVCWGYVLATGRLSPLAWEGGGGDGLLYAHSADLFYFTALQATAATIVSGAMAERTRLMAYAVISCFVDTQYALAVRFAWQEDGWLQQLDPPFHDFAGSGVVHLLGGAAALAGAAVVGARSGRWDQSQASDFVPHNIPFVLGGVLVLWVAWYAFNAGSTAGMETAADADDAAHAAAATSLSAAAAGAASILLTSGLFQAATRRLCGGARARLEKSVKAVRAKHTTKKQKSSSLRLDVLAFANAVLGGLVSITAGCDVIPLPFALVTGAVGGLVYTAAAAGVERLRVDDVVGAFSVHGACGAWGLLATGLFHGRRGLFTTGDPALLASQLAGTLALFALGALPLLVVLFALRGLGWLRVSAEDEASGLDAELGLSAYVRQSDAVRRCRAVSRLLVAHGMSSVTLLEALVELRGIIHRPFTPQAGDHKLEGETKDILEHLKYDLLGTDGVSHLAFLSHHKGDAGDAARVFVDTARRILYSPWAEGSGDKRTGGKLTRSSSRAEKLRATKTKELIFLDSMNLKSLDDLLDHVRTSANHLLLLSRHALERPWVLAELCEAHRTGKNIVVVLTEWGGNDDIGFRYPHDLERVIQEWSFFIANDPDHARAAEERKADKKKRFSLKSVSLGAKSASAAPSTVPPSSAASAELPSVELPSASEVTPVADLNN